MEIIRESMRVGNLVDSFFNGKFRWNLLLNKKLQSEKCPAAVFEIIEPV